MSDLSRTNDSGYANPPVMVTVWDPFVRLFHWSLLALVLAAFVTEMKPKARTSPSAYIRAPVFSIS